MRYFFQSASNNPNSSIPASLNPSKYKILDNQLCSKKVRIDQIKSSDQAIATEFICPLCKTIPLDPVKCPKCNGIFCRNEYTSKIQSSYYCPKNCSYGYNYASQSYIANLTHTEKNLLCKISITCHCREEGLTYTNINTHYSTCKSMTEYSCFECNEIMATIEGIEKHVKEECSNLLTICEYCNAKIKNNEKVNHQKNCMQKCNYCNKSVAKAKMNDHMVNECASEVKKYYENLLREEKSKGEQRLESYKDEIANLKRENNSLHNYINRSQKSYESLKKDVSNLNQLVSNNSSTVLKEVDDINKKYRESKSVKRFWNQISKCRAILFIFIVLVMLFIGIYYYQPAELEPNEES
jgi:hypothetical protein